MKTLILIFLILIAAAVPAHAQFTARNNEVVVFAWDFDESAEGVASAFVVESATSPTAAFTAWATVPGTARETPAQPLVFPSGISKLYFRVVGLDGTTRGQPSVVIDVSRLIGPPKNPRVKG